MIAGAMIDGSIHLWKSAGPYVCENYPPSFSFSQLHHLLPPIQEQASIQYFGAHAQGSETSCLCLSHDNKTLVTRGGKLGLGNEPS